MKKAKKTRKQTGARKPHDKNGRMPQAVMHGDMVQRMLGEAVRCLQEDKAAKAESLCRKIVRANPSHVDALLVLGLACRDLGQLEDGVRYLEKAVALNPHFADAHNNLGTALAAVGRHAEAVDAFWEAIEIRPDYAQAHDNLGLSQFKLGQREEALASFRRALQLDPNSVGALSELAAISRTVCAWADHTALRKSMTARARTDETGINPFWLLSYSDDPALLLQCARRFASDQSAPLPVSQRASRNDEKIRIAYLSADFREHPVAQQILPLIERHDRDRFEVTGIAIGKDDESPMRRRLEQSFDHFYDARMRQNRDIAQMIADRKIHVAVDLTGYKAGLRPDILASRPAPIQVNYLGFPGTMGVRHIDYILVDGFVVPDGQEHHFDEQLVRLPDSHMVAERPPEALDVELSRSEAGLPDDAIVFCAFNNAYKMMPEMFDIWMRVLVAVPKSVLWLSDADDQVQTNLRKEAEQRNVAAARIMFAPKVELNTHLARQRLGDLFLDTLPYNAHSTACDALWAGLPVLTCAGNSFAGRVAGSLLHTAGLHELVTATLGDYERLAVQLATDPDRLAALRETLKQRRNSSPLFDAARFARSVERAYIEMVDKWAQGMPAEPIAVSATPS